MYIRDRPTPRLCCVIASVSGILYPASLPTFHRFPVPEAIGDLVRWFWIPEWDIEPGRASRQQLIAFPASNLTVEPEFVSFTGPATRRSHRDLTGKGWAVGALLRPAAVPGFTDDPTSLRDTLMLLDLPDLHASIAEAMQGSDADQRRRYAVELLAEWLAPKLATVTDEGRLANEMVNVIGDDSTVLRVEDAAARLSVSSRTLQRLAKRYVGLPPLALIRRRRLQEAALRVRTEPAADLAAIAAELGYVDQAHLTKDFRTVLGFTPHSYRMSRSNDEPAE